MSVTNGAVIRGSGPDSTVELVAGLARSVGDMAIDTTGLQTMAGLAAIVLGILALSGFAPTKLALIVLLELGCFSSPTSAVVRGSLARAFRLAPHA